MKVPLLTCDTLNVNLMAADFSGNAASYGALQAAVDTTQDRTLRDLDPRACLNKIYKPTGELTNYGVDISWEIPDCTVVDDNDVDGFTCAVGSTSTPTTTTSLFEIQEGVKIHVKIPYKDWADTCCGVEEYYTQVLEARERGNLSSQVENIIYDLGGRQKSRHYESLLVSERIQHQLLKNSGTLSRINGLILTKIAAAAGYNAVTDSTTGAVVGDATWELPVLEPILAGCATAPTRINPNLFRTEIIRFLRTHPRCESNFSIIGGHKFVEMFNMLDIYCCDSTGINQAQAIRKVAGFMANFYVDDTIDTAFPAGTFFIVENNSLALFWLSLYEDPKRRLTDQDGIGGIFRRTGVTTIPVGNCRTNGIALNFDTMILADNTTCLTEPFYDIQILARFDLWTRPAVGCASENPQTGIYQALLVDSCPA